MTIPTSAIGSGVRSFPRFAWLVALVINVGLTASLLLLGADATVASIAYLVCIVWFATLAGQGISILLAVTSSILFDYYFLPPRYSLSLSGFQSWFAMIAFVLSCVVVARVAEKARLQTRKAEQRREDVECLNALSEEMMLQGDAQELVRELPRLVEKVFGLEAVVLYVPDHEQTYSSIPGGSAAGNTIFAYGSDSDYTSQELVFGMKKVGELAWKPKKLSPEVTTSVGAQVATAIMRAYAIEKSGRLEAARSAERLRSTLVDSMTHELRTPLTAIRAAATTLTHGNRMDEALRTELITIVDEESGRLDRLIGEAMEMAEIDSDGIRVREEGVHIVSFLEDAVEQLRPQLKFRKVSICVEDPNLTAHFDPHLIGRVMHHLLENAARYTPVNSRIVLRSFPLQGRLQFEVEDDGPGIEAEDLPMIFERAYRGIHRPVVGKGSGMGLAICRSILAVHGGEIEAMSSSGQGTVFRFWIPSGEPQTGNREIGEGTEERSSGWHDLVQNGVNSRAGSRPAVTKSAS